MKIKVEGDQREMYIKQKPGSSDKADYSALQVYMSLTFSYGVLSDPRFVLYNIQIVSSWPTQISA